MNERRTIEKELQSIIAHQVGMAVEDIGLEKRFAEDLSMDSLDFVELVLAIETEFCCELNDLDLETIQTVDDLCGFVLEIKTKQLP